jgi:hypothetical protein
LQVAIIQPEMYAIGVNQLAQQQIVVDQQLGVKAPGQRAQAWARATRSAMVLLVSRYCTMRQPPASAASTSLSR